jgi:vacuolar protein sorting-associated protein 8
MTDTDEDPEYEAQLKDVLGDTQWHHDGLACEAVEAGDGDARGRDADMDGESEDGVLDDVPSFRIKKKDHGRRDQDNDPQLQELLPGDEERVLSEDARSISTGDDSPSAQVPPPNIKPLFLLSVRPSTDRLQGSEITLSTPATPIKSNGYTFLSPLRAFSPSPGRGFDIRTPHQRLSSYSSLSAALHSPTPSHSRLSSLSATPDVTDLTPSDSPNVPWEVVRWTKLRKIEKQALSEIGKRKFGSPTVMAVSAVIAVGTTKGLVLVFDFRQNLKHVIGVNTKGSAPEHVSFAPFWPCLSGFVAAQSGPVTALAFSADHTVLLCGHSTGEVFTWDLSKPAQPHSHTQSLSPEQISQSKRDGHLSGAAVLHVDFLGLRHGAFVSADETGMAFVHTLSRKLVVANVATKRILGRYPEALGSSTRPIKAHKPSCVLGMGGLPLGSVKFITDEMQLVALLSPYKVPNTLSPTFPISKQPSTRSTDKSW